MDAESPESTIAALSHLARQKGEAGTLWAENLFFTRWLATVQKKNVFPDITLLLERGRSQGPESIKLSGQRRHAL
ncbi:hypothetical protein CO704_24940 (plasmid) [Cedecea neteri]|uniref:Uncharacterized protein n=2 Tax=Cedecea neteri TaxID=158822 RepID=A0A291E5L7_9ENTR|nr:hypothetical protein CO704_24940 [Cedecea neteri]